MGACVCLSLPGVCFSRSGVTRLVDNLVAEGLIERQRFEGDARGSEAVLTEKGRRRLEDLSQVHFDGVKDFFTGRLNNTELDSLADLLDKLVDLDGEGENC